MERFLEPEDQRQVFYDALSTYARTLKVALPAPRFYENTPEGNPQIQIRPEEIPQFAQDVKLRYAEAIDFRDYEQKIRKLLDAHIDADGVTCLPKRSRFSIRKPLMKP